MKPFRDLLPVLVFFGVYQFAGIYWATAAAIVATAAQTAWLWLHEGHIETLPLATLGILVIFGGLTIALQDPIFVMWKPTLVNWLLAAVLLASHWIGERPLVERLMGGALALPPSIWRRLNAAWAAFFIALGLANLFVIYIGSGFYGAYRELLTASGAASVDLASCLELATGRLLELCQRAQRSESIWVDFKLFGVLGLTFAFAIAQALYLGRYLPASPKAEPD